MLKNKLLTVILLLMIFSSAQAKNGDEEGSIYMGYNFGKFSPGLGNVLSTVYLYNQRYGADFKYYGLLNGPVFGVRGYQNLLEFRFEWIFRHGKTESTFIEPTSGTEWKLGIKTRYNTWLLGMGFHFGDISIGAGVDIGKFKLFTKRTPIDDYEEENWEQETNLYGKKVVLMDANLYDIVGGWIFYFEYVPGRFGIRAYLSQPMTPVEYGSYSTILTYYNFMPTNFGITLLVNLITD